VPNIEDIMSFCPHRAQARVNDPFDRLRVNSGSEESLRFARETLRYAHRSCREHPSARRQGDIILVSLKFGTPLDFWIGILNS